MLGDVVPGAFPITRRHFVRDNRHQYYGGIPVEQIPCIWLAEDRLMLLRDHQHAVRCNDCRVGNQPTWHATRVQNLEDVHFILRDLLENPRPADLPPDYRARRPVFVGRGEAPRAWQPPRVVYQDEMPPLMAQGIGDPPGGVPADPPEVAPPAPPAGAFVELLANELNAVRAENGGDMPPIDVRANEEWVVQFRPDNDNGIEANVVFDPEVPEGDAEEIPFEEGDA